MHIRNQPPVFVPAECAVELEKLSKAALMDIAWDLATRCAGVGDNEPTAIMAELRKTAEIITVYRKEAKAA